MTEDTGEAKRQLQIGDRVTYKPEGLWTTVTGYVWQTPMGSPPRIWMYSLDCGIQVCRKHLEEGWV